MLNSNEPIKVAHLREAINFKCCTWIEIINNCLSESKQKFVRLIKRGTSRQLHVQS